MPRLSGRNVGLRLGFKSGLESAVAQQLKEAGVVAKYESLVIAYTKPASKHRYTPDFPLPNGIIVETKGRFLAADRAKHLLVREQHPELDIRFVFSSSKGKIATGSKTTNAMWCDANGFLYADKRVPEAWLKEKRK